MNNLKQYFQLDDSVTFLNHGSFGATPKPVMKSYHDWQTLLERQPVLFLGRRYDDYLLQSRTALAAEVNCAPEDVVYIPNATYGVNTIARSLKLQPGDEILTSDHEYGACDYTWEFVCKSSCARYVHQPIPLPVQSLDQIAQDFLAGVTERTRVIYLSHITSPTALRMPVEQVCKFAREHGIITVIDAAHALGQLPLNLTELDADFYTSNCHKWSLAPKGAAFLYAHKRVQHLVEPLVVSWGYGNDPALGTGSRFVDIMQWSGTKDPAAELSVPEAINFMHEHNWEAVRGVCHALLIEAIERISLLTGLPPVYPMDSDLFIQMGVAQLPASVDMLKLKARLYDGYKVELPLTQYRDKKLMRISVQGYNDREDIDRLLDALKAELV